MIESAGKRRSLTKPQSSPFVLPPYQLSENSELTRVVSQFFRANRPNVVELKEF